MVVANQEKPLTLRRVWNESYTVNRDLSPITLRNYEMRLNHCFSDWLDLPVASISSNMLLERHQRINGRAMANSAMRTFRALLNHAIDDVEDGCSRSITEDEKIKILLLLRSLTDLDLSDIKGGVKSLEKNHLIAYFRSAFALQNQTARDLYILLLLTGLKLNEARTLRWEDVDLRSRLITVPQVSSSMNSPYLVPLSDYAYQILAYRNYYSDSRWVFPGNDAWNPISRTDKSWKKLCGVTGIDLAMRDLRSSFIGFAKEAGVEHELIRWLVNHKIYEDELKLDTRPSIQLLRQASQRVTDFILVNAGIRTSLAKR